MDILLSQYGKTVLYVIIAITIIIPLIWLSLTDMNDLTYNQSENTNRDNAYLLEYEAPSISVSNTNIKISVKDKNVDLKQLFNVKATINKGETLVDNMFINYDTDFKEGEIGIYNVSFKCTHIYKSNEGYDIPRESVLDVKVIVE